jgi:putative Holliday junction resolvase
MALDVGSKRIGIAISDTTQNFAFPRKAISRKNGIANISTLLLNEDVELIIVGMPYLPSGEVGTQAKITKQFIVELSQSAKIKIEPVDERMSTKEAINKSEEIPYLSKKIKKDKGVLDSYSAAVILQYYLDHIKN